MKVLSAFFSDILSSVVTVSVVTWECGDCETIVG